MRRRGSYNLAFIIAASLIAALIMHASFRARLSLPVEDCTVSFGKYEGPSYSTDQTESSKCLVQNNWLRLMQHSVRLGSGGSESSSLIGDWLFVDYHDRVNVLVEDETVRGEGATKRYRVLKQTKYALDGKESYAVVGGIIEPGEDEATAARREVREEMGLVCDVLIPLGRYRTDVNRGMGWVNSFIASDCRRQAASSRNRGTGGGAEEVGEADLERQDLISLTVNELRDAARNGRFVEVQWSNTVSLALLRL